MRGFKAVIALVLGVIIGICSMCVCGFKHRSAIVRTKPTPSDIDTSSSREGDSLNAIDTSMHPPNQEGLPIKKPLLE